MMIEYGVALLVVCVLSLLDRASLPYALILSAGWLLGFLPAEAWPAISLWICGTTLFLYRRCPSRVGAAVHAIAVGMLLCDVAYWGSLVQGRYIGVEYAYALNFGLSVQLLLVGHRGAINGWIGLLDWSRAVLRGSCVRSNVYPSKEA